MYIYIGALHQRRGGRGCHAKRDPARRRWREVPQGAVSTRRAICMYIYIYIYIYTYVYIFAYILSNYIPGLRAGASCANSAETIRIALT